jgi:DNA-directed RNA polymerase specialized sigma24 family protein
MSKNSSKSNKMAGGNDKRTIDEIFQALPPLGSDDYVAHISSADKRELPPEVLARALRQLPPTSPAFEATLTRLLRRTGKTWEYFRPLMAKARRMAVGTHDYEDVLQDALGRICQILPTNRGELSETAWHAFCRREADDAWRERFGRRGERLPKEDAVGAGEVDGEADNEEQADDSPEKVLECEVLPSWHVKLVDGNNERIEQTARMIVDNMPDGFVRDVAERAWFEDMRPKISGTAKGDAVPLTDVFPGKSRHQIQRALRQADAQLAAALLGNEEVDWSKEEQGFLERIQGVPSSAIRKEES